MLNPKKVFSNILFYVFFVFFLLVGVYVLNGDVFSFGRLGKWTFFQNVKVGDDNVRQASIDDTAIGTALANIKLGKGDISKYYYLGKAMDYIKSTETLVNVDLVELLDNAVNKPAVLETHIKQMITLKEKMTQVSDSMTLIASEKRQESESCQNNKTTADRDFSRGVSNNEKDLLFDGLESSLESGPCFIESRIMSNAYFIISDKLSYYISILNGKLSLIENNQEMILQNYKYFRDNYLDELIDIRNKLDSYKTNLISE